MRYDTPIYFQEVTEGGYSADTGNYEDSIVEETLVFASVMDTQAEMLTLVYGKIRQGSLTVHVQNHFKRPFDRIRIGEKVYQIDHARNLRVKQAYIISEVQ